ncbi:Mis12 protein-domain-containing protein [Xylariaceae sp. FL0255]|nr:Mis12 protein-domain-containing protein [Xylariaceae sp. FL0255]
MANPPISDDTELLTEHFGYPPVSLIDDIINSVNILAERALNSVEQGLLTAPPSALGFKASKSRPTAEDGTTTAESEAAFSERIKTEIEAGTHQLETLLCASIDRNFDKFEIWVLRNILTVRPDLRDWMRLSHYEGLDFPSSSNENASSSAAKDTPTIESVTALRRHLRESMRLNALLTAEKARNDALLDDLRRLVGSDASQIKTETLSPQRNQDATAVAPSQQSPFAFLHQKTDLASSGGGEATPLTTTAAFTMSQMQSLRALSTSLRTLLPDLKAITASGPQGAGADDAEYDGSGPKSWRRERLEYVEGATRRHLETVQGLELGRHGAVRDGEWQGSGQTPARAEVEGIERVVALIGGGSGGGGEQVVREAGDGQRGEEEDGEQMDEL